MQCYLESLNEIQQKPVYNTVRNALQDTLDAWMSRKLNGIRSLKHSEWKIDEAVFFNNECDKAILLVLNRDTQKIVNFRTKENPELRAPTQDNIETVFAYIENGNWQFYTYTMPTIVVIREQYGKKDPMTFEELSKIGRKEVLQSYYKHYSCKINPESFKMDKSVLDETHAKFLDNNSSIYKGMDSQ